MLRKIPLIGSLLTPDEVTKVFCRRRDPSSPAQFAQALSAFLPQQAVYLASSGIAAFFLILKALQSLSPARVEVILPAYTAGSLVVAVRKAGLIPVLCDCSLADYNLDAEFLEEAVTARTLAVVCVHMFGIPMSGIVYLRAALPREVFLVEDCAQALGSRVAGKPVGSFSDISFWSFNRGKNLPLGAGGCIATQRTELIEAVKKGVSLSDTRGDWMMYMKAVAFSFVTRPFVYGAGYSLIACFKETRPPNDFSIGGISLFQSALGIALCAHLGKALATRMHNGEYLRRRLQEVTALELPAVEPQAEAAYNRFPFLLKEAGMAASLVTRFNRAGIEISPMYGKPLHQMFSLGYPLDSFPRARAIAGRLLALPLHPGVSVKEMDTMAGLLRTL